MGSEKLFENRIKKFLQDQGCWFVKYWSGNARNGKKFTKDGVPDIILCCNGRFIGLELKAPTGKATELQKHHLKMIDRSGGYGILLYPNEETLFKNFILCLNQSDFRNADLNYELLKGRWLDG